MPDEPLNFTVTEGHDTFESWVERDFINEATRKEILGANVLIVPQMGFGEFEKPVFPVCTEEIYNFIREKAPTEIKAEICINEEDYRELALHADLIVLGHFLVSSGASTITLGLILEYLKRRIWKSGDDKTKAKLTYTVVNADGSSRTLTYEGPAQQIEPTFRAALPSVSETLRSRN